MDQKRNFLEVGDFVTWCGNYGGAIPKKVQVINIEKCELGSRYGSDVWQVPWDEVDKTIVVDLANGHWAYGNQISKLD